MLLLGYEYIRDNLARFGRYPTNGDVADMSNLFYFHFVFYDQGRWRVYRDIAFQIEMGWTININTIASLARQKLCEYACANLN